MEPLSREKGGNEGGSRGDRGGEKGDDIEGVESEESSYDESPSCSSVIEDMVDGVAEEIGEGT
jgi:hypothetical protein